MALWDTYSQNPWAGITSKTRDWYVPQLYSYYRQRAVYNNFVNVRFNMAGMGAETMHLSSQIAPHANHDPIDKRQLEVDSSYLDFMSRNITFNHYAGEINLNRYDERVTYYQKDSQQGLIRMINEGLGYMMVETMEKLARDTFLKAPFAMYGRSATGADFGDISSADKITEQLIDDINLGMKERDVPFAQTGDGSPGSILCVTSPGVLFDLKTSADWIDKVKYADGTRLMAGEVGSFHGVRFVETNRACLYNAGEWDGVGAQTTITAAVNAGDGAPNPTTTAVDQVYYVGQAAKTHTITVASTTGIVAGDIVSIHVDRTSTFGITNGLDYRDGKLFNRRVVSVPDSTHLVFDLPFMEAFTTDLGGGVYGYVTKGRNVHTSLFLGAPDGVVMGVLESPQMYALEPIDSLKKVYRFVWQAMLGYQLFNPRHFEVLYTAGSNRYSGARYVR